MIKFNNETKRAVIIHYPKAREGLKDILCITSNTWLLDECLNENNLRILRFYFVGTKRKRVFKPEMIQKHGNYVSVTFKVKE